MVTTQRIGFLSGNVLKLLAAAFMLIDHIGMIFFPQVITYRAIGRLAMPIFAFMIAEGCRYTRSRLRYLASLMLCALICQVGLYIGTADTYLCILVTFTLGAAMVFCMQQAKEAMFAALLPKALLWSAAFVLMVAFTRLVCSFVTVDYGFWGCMLPVFASLFHMPPAAPGWLKRLDCKWVHIAAFTAGLVLQSLHSWWLQFCCLLSLPLLLCYSGRRGTAKLKYFFYIFYPAHLVLLYGLYMIIGVM